LAVLSAAIARVANHGTLAVAADDARPSPTKPETNSIGMQLVQIPAGEFTMGRTESADELAKAFPDYDRERIDVLSDEQPHRVRITKPFELGATEVTIGQFKRFIDDGNQSEAERDGTGGWGYNPAIAYFEGRKPQYSWRNPGFKQADDHPVVNVTWNDAVAFCQWLGKKEGRKYRLPTEAEWEYACRAGTTTRYHIGDDPNALVKVAALYDADTKQLFPQFGKYAVPASDGYEFTAPVGSFKPNAFGLFDMHGNVWEWCSDWYDEEYYAHSPVDDPRGPDDGKIRVRRGGSWHTWPLYMRSAFRNYNTEETRYVLVGFRVVRELSK
jgi:sulfatase modifying factor 1